jgi:hypothetical protein
MRSQFLDYTLVLILFSLTAVGQVNTLTTGDDDPEMLQSMRIKVPGSPDAARLGTYGEFQMTQSTGIPSVNMPIVSIEAGGITIPVSLNYSSSGLKVDELPSWVGMGWSLTAGGVITRTVKGQCDDMVDGFFTYRKAVPDAGIYTHKLDPQEAESVRFATYSEIQDIYEGRYDYEPDLFSFNFGDRSGSFILGHEGAGTTTQKVLAHVLDYKGLKIEPKLETDNTIALYPVIREWNITDENGLVYKFRDIETTVIRIGTESRDKYISSWYLTSIYNPLTETTANFTYATGPYQYNYEENYDNSWKYTRAEGENVWYETEGVQTTQYLTHSDLKFISQITLKNFSLSFSGMASLEYPKKLETIVWSNGTSSKTFNLGYDYFTPSNRVKLVSLTEYHPSNPKVHSFEYYPGSVPSRENKSQDSWGYFNGASNSSLIPTISYAGENFGFGANRTPSFSHMQVGMLSKIIYPTKGSSAFGYEQNTWEDDATSEDLEQVTYTATTQVTGQGTWTQACSQTNVGMRDGSDGGVSPNKDYSARFTVTRQSMGTDNGKDYPTLTITQTSPSKVLRTIIMAPDLVGPVIEDVIVGAPGSFVWFTICAYGSGQKIKVDVELVEVDRTQIGQPIARTTAGLRIAKIENVDPESGKTVTKTFDYGFGGYMLGSTSPGFIRSFNTGVGGGAPWGEAYQRNTLILSPFATSGIAPSPSQVAYEKVTEWLGTPALNSGRIETIFPRIGDNTSALAPESKHLQRSKVKFVRYFDRAGNLKKDEEYQYQTSTMGGVTGFRVSRVRHIEGDAFPDYSTDFNFANYTQSATWSKLILKKVNTYFGVNNAITESITYEYGSNRHTNVTKETITNSKGEEIETTYAYPLDASKKDFSKHPRNYYLTFQANVNNCRLTSSSQNAFKTCLGTQTDLLVSNYNALLTDLNTELANSTSTTDPTKGQASLNVLNVISQPYDIRAFNADSETSRMLVNWTYKTNVVGTDKPVKDQFSTSYRGGALQPVLKITGYNALSNPIEALDYKSGVTTAYIWDGNYEALIAEVKNAKVGEVAHTSFENGQEGNLTFTSSPSTQAKAGLKSHLLNGKPISKSGLTSAIKYIVSYWAKDGTVSVTGVVGSNDDAVANADGWQYFEKTVSGVTTITISTTAGATTKIDDVRIYPEGALMTTFVHNPGIGVTSVTDPNNQISYFTYDSASGNLITAEDHYRKVLRKFQYNFKK